MPGLIREHLEHAEAELRAPAEDALELVRSRFVDREP
jgi:hypothetical protein